MSQANTVDLTQGDFGNNFGIDLTQGDYGNDFDGYDGGVLDSFIASNSGMSQPQPPVHNPPLQIQVAGMSHHGNHIFSHEDIILLLPDNTNQFDSNAIKVLANGTHVAYVSQQYSVSVRNLLSQLQRIDFVSATPHIATLRLHFY